VMRHDRHCGPGSFVGRYFRVVMSALPDWSSGSSHHDEIFEVRELVAFSESGLSRGYTGCPARSVVSETRIRAVLYSRTCSLAATPCISCRRFLVSVRICVCNVIITLQQVGSLSVGPLSPNPFLSPTPGSYQGKSL
jgi:hypothetical protein